MNEPQKVRIRNERSRRATQSVAESLVVAVSRNFFTPALDNFFSSGLIHPLQDGIEDFFDLGHAGISTYFDAGATSRASRVDVEGRHHERASTMLDLAAQGTGFDSLDQAPGNVD